jgi:DNA-binding GntR family transcriptional regulator
MLDRFSSLPSQIAARLTIPAASRMVKIERVRHTSEDVCTGTRYLEAERFPGLMKEALCHCSPVLNRSLPMQLTYANKEFDAPETDLRITQFLQVRRADRVMVQISR